MPVEFVLGLAVQVPVELVQDIALPEVWPLSVKAEMLSAVLYTFLSQVDCPLLVVCCITYMESVH